MMTSLEDSSLLRGGGEGCGGQRAEQATSAFFLVSETLAFDDTGGFP